MPEESYFAACPQCRYEPRSEAEGGLCPACLADYEEEWKARQVPANSWSEWLFSSPDCS